jgi:fumarylacetoacetase
VSWVVSANGGNVDFPIQNLPFGIFRRKRSSESFRGCVAIGDQVLDLAAVAKSEVLPTKAQDAALACAASTLNAFMAMGPDAWSTLRLALSRALREGAAEAAALGACLMPQSDVEYAVPARIGDYTDFYTSVHHATAIGRQFRPDNPYCPITTGCRSATTGAVRRSA